MANVWPGAGPNRPYRFVAPLASSQPVPFAWPDYTKASQAASTWPGSGPNRRQRLTPQAYGLPPAVILNNPPDGLEVSIAQWGIDVDESRAVKLSGERSLWFKAGTNAATRMRHDAAHRVPVEAGKRYKAWAVFQADNIADSAVAQVAWFSADRVSRPASSVSTIYNAPVTAINKWQRAEAVVTAPSGAYYAAISFGRDGTTANAYFDEVDMLPAIPLWDLYLGTAQSIPSGLNTTVAFDTVRDQTDVSVDTATGIVTIIVPGFYFVSARTEFVDIPDQKEIQISVAVNGTTPTRYGTDIRQSAAAGVTIGVPVQALLSLNVDDTVRVIVFQGDSVGHDATGSASATYFSGTRIM